MLPIILEPFYGELTLYHVSGSCYETFSSYYHISGLRLVISPYNYGRVDP